MKNNKLYRGSIIKEILNKSSIDYESSSIKPRFNSSNISLKKIVTLTGLKIEVKESLYKGICLEDNDFHIGNQYSLEEFILYFYNYPQGYKTKISLELDYNIHLDLEVSNIEADPETLYIKVYEAGLKESCFINVKNLIGELKVPISSIKSISIPNNINWKAI